VFSSLLFLHLTAEANALIGAHTIGLLRHTFGPSLPWVQNGRDFATPFGPVFDNAYHHFLRNTIVEDTAGAFASNQSPFTEVFSNWFRISPTFPNELSHLDTDVTLAFPPVGVTHPDYSLDTTTFASSNAVFLKQFFLALDKMGRLGVNVPLSPATDCKVPCGEAELRADEIIRLIASLSNATAIADRINAQIQANRTDEIKKLTTLVKDMPKPTSRPTTTEKPTTAPTTNKPVTANPTSKPTVTARPTSALSVKPVTANPTSKLTVTARPTSALSVKPVTATPIDQTKTSP